MRSTRPQTARIVLALLLLSACRSEVTPAPSEPLAVTAIEALRQSASERRLTALFLVVDGVYNTELTAPYDVLDHSGAHLPAELGIEVSTVSPDGAPVTTAEGLRILPDFAFDNAPRADILVVPSAEGSRDSDLQNRALVEWLAANGKKATVVMSLCWGAFLLAEAGLLDDRQCTTFPADFEKFASRFPEHDLRVNVSFVHDQNAITSQGGARSFDAAMYLVNEIYGRDVATRVGAGLLISWPPKSSAAFHVVPVASP